MDAKLSELIVNLRLNVGYLGEKSQYGWWDSEFLGASGKAFLSPVFLRTVELAMYRGVSESAMLAHDADIGIGAHYHLFRLPDGLEIAAAKMFDPPLLASTTSLFPASQEEAAANLKKLAKTTAPRIEGPAAIGHFSVADLKHLLEDAASHYLVAFENGFKCFPYMRGTA
jgi:hypothetical protein